MNPARGLADGRLILAALLTLAGSAAGQSTTPSPPRTPRGEPARPISVPAQAAAEPSSAAPIPVLINTPADLEELLKRLNRPDFLVVPGSEVKPASPAATSAPSAPPVISSWNVRGEVFGDLAHLTIQLECRLDEPGPTWVPVKLDGLTVNEVREGGQSLPSRGEGTGTAVELRGAGVHRVQIETRVPVLSTSEGRTLTLAIPPAASTSIQLRVPGVVESCTAGTGEPVACVPVEAGHLTELSTRLSPRAKLQLQWRVKSDAGSNLPPLLSTRGEIALEVDLGTLKARSSWNLSLIRGQLDRLELGLNPTDELVDVELDGRPVAVVSGAGTSGGPMVIPLIDPLRAGQVRTLTLTTRRPLDARSRRELVYSGVRFEHGVDQSGAIAVSQDPGLWIQPVGLRGLRRIDPRTDLPQDLRSRPSITMAFGYNDLPFELKLSLEPSPSRLRVTTNTTVEIDPSKVQVVTVLDCESSRGRPFEVQVYVPEGLEFQKAGPADVVEGTQLRKRPAGSTPAAGSDLSIRMNRQGQDQGRFRVVLQGVAKPDLAKATRIPIFTPIVETPAGGQLAVVTPPGTYAEPSAASNVGAFRRMLAPPRTWEWPASARVDGGAGVSWFRHDSGASELPITMTVLPVQVRHETLTTTNLETPEQEWVSDIRLQVDNGTIRTIDLEIPGGPDDWSLTGANIARREHLRDTPEGRGLHRVWFSRELSGSITLRARGHGASASAKEPAWSCLPDARVVDGEERSRRVRFLAGPRTQVDVKESGWRETSEPGPAEIPGAAPTPAVAGALARTFEALTGSRSPLLFQIHTLNFAELPSLVISRSLLRTSLTPDGGLITTAWFRCEGAARAVDLEIPEGSTLVQIRTGPDGASEVPGDLEAPNRYRVPIAREANDAPFLLGVTYQSPPRSGSAILPPRILGDAVILQAIWEVWVGDNLTGVSVPEGWNDDNRWAWQGTHFLRTPLRPGAEVAGWISSGVADSAAPELFDSGQAEGQHGYQFSRQGGLGPLRFRTVSRFAAVSVCSGLTLAFGLLFINVRIPARVGWSIGVGVAFVLGCVLEPSLSLLVVQSSSFGLFLSLGAAAIHWYLDRRTHPLYASGELSTASALERLHAAGSALSATPEPAPAAEAEGSTAIRPRLLPSTADRLVLTPTQPGPTEEPPTNPPRGGE